MYNSVCGDSKNKPMYHVHFLLDSNLSQAYFHRTLKARQKCFDITLIGWEVAKLMPDQDQKIPYLGLKGYDSGLLFQWLALAVFWTTSWAIE